MLLSCWWKWLLVPFAGPVLFVAIAIVVIVVLIAIVGAVSVPWRLLSGWFPAVAAIGNKAERFMDLNGTKVILLGCVGLASPIGYILVFSPNGIAPCDHCLPEAWRQRCENDREAAERRDRAQFEALCETWHWPECPVDNP